MSIVICPECGRELSVSDPGRKFIFCRHCGTKIEVASFTKKPQEPIITQPLQDQTSEVPSQDASVEQLRHQHELEMEQLRYEHELELERLRHENELKQERIKSEYAETAEPAEPAEEAEYASSAPKVQKHSTKKKSLSWKAGHFCKKHPIWAFIIVIAFFQILFGGTSGSSSSSVSSKPPATGVSSKEHNYSSSYNFSSAYTYTSAGGNVYYFLFDLDSQKVCFVSSASDDASISTLSGSDFTTGADSVFHYSNGNYHRNFKYHDSLSDSILTVTESWNSETPVVAQFEKTDVEIAETALNKKRGLQITTLPD